MKNIKYIFILLVIYLTSCQNKIPVTISGQSTNDYISGNGVSTSYSINGKWELQSINEEDIVYGLSLQEQNLRLEFSKIEDSTYRVIGKNVGNTFTGRCRIDDKNLKFEEVKSTLKGLLGSQAELEKTYIQGILQSKSYEVKGSELALYSDEKVLKFGLVTE